VLGVGQFAAQSDYFQATKGGGNGDYRLIVLAPYSVQEMADLTYLAFDLADKYRNPALILADGILGQMAEGVDLESLPYVDPPVKDWALTGAKGRKRNTIIAVPGYHPIVGTGLDVWFKTPPQAAKYAEIARTEQRWQSIEMDDAEYVLVAYGTTARVCSTVVDHARKKGIKAGMIRPITLWPFPSEPFGQAAGSVKAFLTVEMNYGQMVEDVIIAAGGGVPVHHQTVFLSQPLFSPDQIFQRLKSLMEDC
jgi:2-oxoglutarate ferredoxin oxidoreductase subunit alpha